jgi:phosphatidate cytidylyltransferase
MVRTITALILIPVALLVVIYATPVYFLIGIGLVGTACLYEYFRLIRAMGIPGQSWFGYVAFWILLVASRLSNFSPASLLALVLMAAFLTAMWRRKRPVRERVLAIMAELFGILYLILFLCPALSVRYDFGNKIGLQWSLILLIVIWAGDSIALVIGKMFGKSPFAPVLSPKKTNEGALAGLFPVLQLPRRCSISFLQTYRFFT